jgi:signal transduction histidine kinase
MSRAVADVRAWLAVSALGALGALLVAFADSPRAGLVTAALLAVVAGPALAVAMLLARRRRAGPLARQFTLAVAVAIGQLLATSALFVALMFVSPHDALLLCLVAVFCGAVAVATMRPWARGVLSDVEDVRDALDAVAAGKRDVHIDAEGTDELADLARAANRMVARLATAEDTRRHLVAAVSHDLRTPIASLRLLADGLRDEVIAPEERVTYLDTMGVHLRALSALIDDLFELTRLEAGDVTWSMQRVELADLVDETVEAMRAQAEAAGVRVCSAVARDVVPVHGDPERLQRVLFNLIQNAISHTPRDGSVTVVAEPVDGRLEVEVKDTGNGIADGDRESIFDAFFRGGDRAARGGGGAGLGLAISRAIVEAHGGRIWLEGTDRGTRVRFSLSAA